MDNFCHESLEKNILESVVKEVRQQVEMKLLQFRLEIQENVSRYFDAAISPFLLGDCHQTRGIW